MLSLLKPVFGAAVRDEVPQLIWHTPSQDGVPAIFRLPDIGSCNLYETTIDQLQSLFSGGQLTSKSYVQFCLDRIHAVSIACHSASTRSYQKQLNS